MLRHEPGRILVTAHRGVSGANIPCNTRTAFDIALAQGADILELDVARSRDGQLFVFHPGMEKPHLGIDASLSELTAEEIRALRFLNQDNVPTSYGVVPLEEMFAHLRDKAYINVDKFWMWMEEITHAIYRSGVEKQVIVKTPGELQYLEQVEKTAPELMYMPVVYHKDDFTCHALEKNIRYIGVEAIFSSDGEEIVSDAYIDRMHKQGLMLFGNAIVYNEKANISAGHTDDVALKGDPDLGWGWFVQKKFDIIQTDWCSMLKNYLNCR